MFQNMKLGLKISGGFGLVLGLLLIVMGLYQFVVSTTSSKFQNLLHQEMAIEGLSGEIEALMLECRRNEKDFLIRLDKKYVERLGENIHQITRKAAEIKKLGEAQNNPKIADQAVLIIDNAKAYHGHFKNLVASWEIQGLNHTSGLQGQFTEAARTLAEDVREYQIDDLNIAFLRMRESEKDYVRAKNNRYKQKLLKSMDTYKKLLKKSSCEENSKQTQLDALASYEENFNQFLADQSAQRLYYRVMKSQAALMESAIADVFFPDAKALVLDIRKNEKDYLLLEDEKYFQDTIASINNLLNAMANSKILQEHADAVKASLDQYKTAFEGLVAEKRENIVLTAKMLEAIQKVEPIVQSLHTAMIKESNEKESATMRQASKMAKLAIAIGSGAVLIGILLSFFITRAVTKPINLIIEGLSDGANQVASASDQVSSASRSLASGSSQQAASIEETSSSMEEMSSMTSKNADNAGHADKLMKEANLVVTTANNSMAKLIQSMEDISKASEETSNIIKTIDEIAFQTNLLALNAAVEAARAGEAGAGFAVVADEVRNLAMRSAAAARNTAELIEGTVKKVEDGSQLVSMTNAAFGEVAGSTAKVGDLVAEISEASKEQSIGIEQVNNAVSEMDKIVQQNAANAEETASGSEEMSAQAEQLNDYVDELVALVTGRKNQRPSRRAAGKPVSPQPIPQDPRDNKRLIGSDNEMKPGQVIPFDDDQDFKDF